MNSRDANDADWRWTLIVASVLPKLVGQRVKRREDPRVIQGRGTGRGTYGDDVKIAGMQHLTFKRSDVAHGRIRSIDTSAAEARDGVEAVFAHIAKFLAPMPIGTPFPSPEHRAVTVDTVRFAGDPVAVVVACDRYVARDAADAIEVDYEPLPPAVDPETAMTGRPAVLQAVFPNNVALGPLPSGTCIGRQGDIDYTRRRGGGRDDRPADGKDSDRYKVFNLVGVTVCNSIPRETHRGPARVRPSVPWSP